MQSSLKTWAVKLQTTLQRVGPAKAVADSRLQCTVGVAVPMAFGEKWYSHIIFPGTSNRSLPKTTWGDDMLCDCTQNHWQFVDSLLRLVDWLDAKTNSTDAKENWLFVLHCAPVHTAQDLRARLPQHVRLCYINPGTTSIAQPCDVGIMKPFKAALAQAVGKHFAGTILDTL
eukprot:914895-Amphidinium_carterae.1